MESHIESVKKYIKMIESKDIRVIERFEDNSNIIDLEFHIYQIGKFLKSEEHHSKRGLVSNKKLKIKK